MPGQSSLPGQSSKLRELALVFLRLGSVALGGPVAQLAMIREEVVDKRGWMTQTEFLDRVGASNLIPGPNTTELAIFAGFLRAGWAGLVVAGVCYLMPSAVIVSVLAWLYVRFGTVPQVTGVLYGLKPAVIAVVAHSIWKLGRSTARTRFLAGLGLAAFMAAFLGAGTLMVILIAGVVGGLREWWVRGRVGMAAPAILVTIAAGLAAAQLLPPLVGPETRLGAPVAGNVFLYFLRTGSVIFGGGMVLVAFLQKDLVGLVHWVTAKQLLDGVAAGWVTPGPVFTIATFLGYVMLGWPGAVLATVGIFLPSFFACAISGPLIPKLRESTVAGAFLDGVNAASIALMAAVTWDLAKAALVDPLSIGLAVASLLIALRFSPNPAWLILAGGMAGMVLHAG